MKKVYKAKISEMAKVVADLEAFCLENGLDSKVLFAFNLCLDEIFTNIINYGYRGKEGEVEIEMSVKDCIAKAIVRDSAPKFNLLADAKEPNINASLEDREIGGLGIYFVKNSMDEILYARRQGFNELTLIKKLPCLK